MNQEKIGKFIASLRREKNMTQKELAEKLGVTDRAISNWENGKNMPDLVLFKDLCSIFEITINDLLSGEKIDNNNYREKFEENVTNMVVYSNKKSWRKRILIVSIFVLILLGDFLSNLYFINEKLNAENKEEVSIVFNESVRELEKDIKRYLMNKLPKEYVDNDGKTLKLTNMAVVKTFLVEEINENEIYVYLWAVVGSHNIEADGYLSVISKPYKLTLRKSNTRYEVIEEETLMDDSEVGTSFADNFELRKFVNDHFSDRAKLLFNDFYFNKRDVDLVYDYWDIVDTFYY